MENTRSEPVSPRRIAVLRLVSAIAAAAFLFPAARPAAASESIFAGNPSAEGKARGGADYALSRHALCMRTNPAGMGLIEGNREDIYALALWNKLDFHYGRSGGPTNGDAPSFGLNAGYVFTPSRLLADPLFIWTRRSEKDAPYVEGGFIGHNTLRAKPDSPPAMLGFRIKGIGFRVGEISVKAEVAEDSVIRTYAFPEPEPLPDQPVSRLEVAFSFKSDGRPETQGATLHLKAYGQTHSAMLERGGREWAPASISMPLNGSMRPAEIELTVVSEARVEMKDVVVLRTVLTSSGHRVVRSPIAYEDLRISVDEGVATVTLDSTSAAFDGKAAFDEVFVVHEFPSLNPERIRSLSVSYKYGFAGQGRAGEAALFINGRPAAMEAHAQQRVLTIDEERHNLLRKSVKRFEDDKFHVGAAVFTDAWAAADYGDTPTRIGSHEEQIRYSMFSVSPAVAYKIADGLSVGASLDVYYSRFSNLDTVIAQPWSVLRGPGGTFGSAGAFYAASTGNDAVMIQFDTDKLSAFGAGGRIGAIWEPDPALSFGAAASLPSFLSKHIGTAKADFHDDFYFTDFENDLQTGLSLPLGGQAGFEGKYDVSLSNFGMPAVLGIGAAFRPVKDLLVAIDFSFVPWTWSRRDYLKIEFKNGTNPDLNALTGGNFTARIPLRLENQYVVAAGISADVAEELTLHAGYRWASNPLDGNDLLPLFPLHLEHHASFGATIRIFTLEFHVAVTHGFGGTLRAGRSTHTSELDGSKLYAQENSMLVGVSYRY